MSESIPNRPAVVEVETGNAATVAEQHQLFRAVLQAMPNMVALKDCQGRYLEVNDAFVSFFMLPRSEVLGKTAADLYQPDLAALFQADDQEVLERGLPVRRDVWMRGSVEGRWWTIVKTAAHNAAGEIIGVLTTCSDISDRKRAEDELRRSQTRLEQVIDGTNAGIWDWDVSSGAVLVSQRCADMLGYRLDELKFFSMDMWHALYHPDDVARSIELLQRHFRRELPHYDRECRVRHREGYWLWIHERGKVVEWAADGRPLRMCGTYADITERKLAEQELRESEARVRAITGAANDAILMMDPEGKISYWNPAAEAILGYSAAEALGHDLHDLLAPPTYHRAQREAFARFVRTGQGPIVGKAVEFHALRKDRQQIIVSLSLSAIHLADGWNAVGILRDITERRRMEEELRRSKEELERHVAALQESNQALEDSNRRAEAATRAKSAFLANMSHEIRTPMTAILGFTDIILAEAGLEQAPPERVEALQTIQRNGRYLLELINDILDLSKIECGKLEVERGACRPAELLQEVVRLMQVRADAKGLTLALEIVGPLPQTVVTDALRLRQVLINLIGNAVKFTEVGGVRLVARFAPRDRAKGTLRVEVVDSGVGITAEQLERLFQPFAQAESRITRTYGGTGLGLSISKRLCQLLGGDLSVSSVAGQGSTFAVELEVEVDATEQPAKSTPATGSRRMPPTSAAAQPLPSLAGRILFAEDGPDNQRLIGFVLKKAGAEVTLVDNGAEACCAALDAQAAGRPFDLILMDMQMPVLDGCEATRRLRAAGYAGPIVALTANAMDGAEESCRAAGCDDYTVKPIDRARLLAMMAKHLAARTAKPAPA